MQLLQSTRAPAAPKTGADRMPGQIAWRNFTFGRVSPHDTRPMTADTSQRAPAVTAEGETFASAPKRLKYVTVTAPAPGSSVEIAPGVRWARIPLPMDLNHINVWLVATDGGCVIVDTGMAVQMGKDAWEAIERETFATQPVRAVFVTHIHPDHSGLAAWLQERYRVPVLMSSRTHEMMRVMSTGEGRPEARLVEEFFRSHGLSDSTQIQPMLKPERFGRMISGLPQVERYVADSDTVHWGGGEWLALQTDGHAQGHLCLSNVSCAGADQRRPGAAVDLFQHQLRLPLRRSESAALVSRFAAATACAVDRYAGAAFARVAVLRPAAAHRRPDDAPRGAAREGRRALPRAEDRRRAATFDVPPRAEGDAPVPRVGRGAGAPGIPRVTPDVCSASPRTESFATASLSSRSTPRRTSASRR